MYRELRFWTESTLNAYSQVFFSTYTWFGLILLVMTFLEPALGLSGLMIVLLTNLLARWFGFDHELIRRGDYSFNALLVGLGLGAYYVLNLPFLILLITAAIIVLLVTIFVSGILTKYGLPYLSVPFLLAFWLLLLASANFSALGLSERGVFMLNELYATGNSWLVNIYQSFYDLPIHESIMIYIKSLGAIFFQFNIVAGLLVAIGLFLYSRIAFTASLISFYSAYLFYGFIGAEMTDLSYSYIGFNFVLSGIAVGAFFLIPSWASYLWLIILVPAMVVITASLGNLFAGIGLGIYSLPFNMVVLAFLYTMIVRKRKVAPHLVPYQWYSPEKNLYSFTADRKSYENAMRPSIGLPFYGEWQVSQSYSGPYTHKGPWKEALDFVMIDEQDATFKNDGKMPEDYYCYGKPVIAPADGEVVYVENGIEDNPIGTNNLIQNWGNTIVIHHGSGIYSSVSHLQYQSARVARGDHVYRGQRIGTCGNSGRSPYPHLHFQVQASPEPGAPTIPYPVDRYIVRKNGDSRYVRFGTPETGDEIMSFQQDKVLSDLLAFQPGQELFATYNGNKHKWTVNVDAWNHPYIESEKTKVFFRNDGMEFRFLSLQGSKKDPLNSLFRALYTLPLVHSHGTDVDTEIPLHLADDSFMRYLSDIIAPFYRFRKAMFHLEYKDSDPAHSEYSLTSTTVVAGEAETYDITINDRHIDICDSKNNTLNIKL